MDMPANAGGSGVMRRSYRIHDRDFVVNSIWEGAGDELHSNDLYAARTGFGARIVSGIALVSLCVAPRMGELGWPAPRRAALSFDRAVKSGDQIDIDLKEHPSGEAMEVAVGGRRALRVDFGQPADVVLKRSADFLRTKGRTFTAGDREAFDWWITASLPDVTLAPEAIVPWPLLASAVSGFIGRIDIVKAPHLSLVNRFNEWSFFRSVRIGETVHAEVHDPRERDSVSKPGWGIWTARVIVVSDSDGDIVACSKWVCMYMHADEQ